MSFTTLVDVGTLKEKLGSADWRIVDVRHQLANPEWGEQAYADGHIPGAVFLHCDRDLSGPVSGRNGRHPLPDPARLAVRLGELGIGPETQVVVYDDAQGMIAGRLWWLLRWLGHDKVALLDGGLQAWLAEGGALEADLPHPVPVVFKADVRDVMVTADYVQEFMATARMHLIDARSPDRFRGENETLDRVGGHIPGAVNRFFRDNLREDGRFKSAEELRAEWLAVLDGQPVDRVVHQCGSGVSACHNLLAMEIAGLSGGKLYAGSWSEWCSDPARPVVR